MDLALARLSRHQDLPVSVRPAALVCIGLSTFPWASPRTRMMYSPGSLEGRGRGRSALRIRHGLFRRAEDHRRRRPAMLDPHHVHAWHHLTLDQNGLFLVNRVVGQPHCQWKGRSNLDLQGRSLDSGGTTAGRPALLEAKLGRHRPHRHRPAELIGRGPRPPGNRPGLALVDQRPDDIALVRRWDRNGKDASRSSVIAGNTGPGGAQSAPPHAPPSDCPATCRTGRRRPADRERCRLASVVLFRCDEVIRPQGDLDCRLCSNWSSRTKG